MILNSTNFTLDNFSYQIQLYWEYVKKCPLLLFKNRNVKLLSKFPSPKKYCMWEMVFVSWTTEEFEQNSALTTCNEDLFNLFN